jgi:hypothetical protein
MSSFVVWLVGYALKLNLSTEHRNKIVIHLLTALHAVPLSAIIDTNEQGEMLISGNTINIEKGIQLRGQAQAALKNQALNLIREQVKYETYVGAATKTATPEDLCFYRAALWWGQREEYFLKLLAQVQQEQPEL